MNTPALENRVHAHNWQAAMQHFLKTEVEYHRAASGNDDGLIDDVAEKYSDARWDLMRMPAPDLPTLWWKLDYLLEGSNGSTDSYALTAIEPVKRDMNRLMRSGSDTAITGAWTRRLTALRIYNALSPHEEAVGIVGERSPAEQTCWDEIDAADEEIRNATATTVEGARIQLHCAMLGMVGKKAEEAALLLGDMEAFAEVADLDYPMQLAFSALRSLSAMEKAA